MVWIAQGVDFSTPCRQRLIPFKPLTNRQKYKTLGSSTLLCKAACGVPVFFGVQGFEPAKAHLIRKSRLRLSASDLALCVTREMMQTAFSVFSKGKEISFLTWSSALPPVSRSADSLFLRLWLLPLSAPGSGRTQSPGNPSVAVLK